MLALATMLSGTGIQAAPTCHPEVVNVPWSAEPAAAGVVVDVLDGHVGAVGDGAVVVIARVPGGNNVHVRLAARDRNGGPVDVVHHSFDIHLPQTLHGMRQGWVSGALLRPPSSAPTGLAALCG